MNKDLLVALAWGGGIVAVALVASYLRSQGIIDEDTTVRVVAMNGLAVAYYGNLAPKKFAPSAYARQIARFSGWAMVIGGLTYAGFWAFAPLDLAKTIGTGSLAAAVLATVGYLFWLWNKARTTRS